ncbi:MAG: isocitrate lyase/phosphoenolpyruvate mutase family protein [Acetobacteraceae bacterium]|nr:isocitrate lyase/phosphoenolpyruvate mutase family protein [Acetobacteraceae bacterium]
MNAHDSRRAFRALHSSGFFIIPNAWDAGSAVRLAALGFKALASTSSGAAWAVGRKDGELGRNAVLAHLRLLVAATDLPINADFEDGFADAPEEVAANVELALETGVAGLSIEDWSGARFYDTAHAVERLHAAREAMDRVDPQAMLVGRHEHFRDPAEPAADAIARAVAYAQAGADCLFVPMLNDPGAVAELIAAVSPKPVNVLVHEFDDRIPALARAGVRRVSVGGSLARAAWDGFDRAAETLRAFEPSSSRS